MKKLSKILTLFLVATLFLTACGNREAEEAEEPEVVEKMEENEEELEEIEEEPELTEEEIKAEEERTQKVDTQLRALDLMDEIIEDFEDVNLEEERIQLTDDNKNIYTADIYLYLDNENEEEAVKLIDQYSEIFEKEFGAEEEYEEIILYWLTPNHDKSQAIEKIYY